MQLLRDPKLDHKTKIISNLAPKKNQACVHSIAKRERKVFDNICLH